VKRFAALRGIRRAVLPGVLLGVQLGVLAACTGAGEAREPEGSRLPAGSGFYRQAMRELVQGLGAYARDLRPGFILVPQNGLGLLTRDGTPDGEPAAAYLGAIDAVGQEELFYGYPRYGQPTPPESTRHLLGFLRLAQREGKTVLVIDYCRRKEAVGDSARRSAAEGFLSFQAPRRELDVVPRGPAPAGGEIESLDQARSFLYLINPGRFADAASFVRALGATSHDVLVVDAFVPVEEGGSRWLTAAEVRALQRKPSGERRLVLAYLSVGEAESYRYYWQEGWDRLADGVPDRGAPSWLQRANPRWPGNYKVRYWDSRWQAILFGGEGAYLDGILARGFDGVYLDLVDAYLYFEERSGAAR
jgi:cysteinyl-tRNA synthetase